MDITYAIAVNREDGMVNVSIISDEERVSLKGCSYVALEPDPESSDSEEPAEPNIIQPTIPLRRSLFPHVPPYIQFHCFQSQDQTLPNKVKKQLRFRLHHRSPAILRQILRNSGYSFISGNGEWCGSYGFPRMRPRRCKSLKEFQKISYFPGTFQMGRKDQLWLLLNRMKIKHGREDYGFFPMTYILPEEMREFRRVWDKQLGKKWIVKPPCSCCGDGVRVVHLWSEVPKERAVQMVVQEYLSRPKLIDDAKFDLRLYVLVTSFNSLRIYLYTEGLVRFATEKYTNDSSSLRDKFIHLTNCSINKFNSLAYKVDGNVNPRKGHLWSLKGLWAELKKDHVDVPKLWKAIKDVVVKTMISVESCVNRLSREHLSSRYSCYELFGLDILVDEDLRPWLLEVNLLPSLDVDTPVEVTVKGPLLRNVLNIAGYQIPDSLSSYDEHGLAKSYNLDKLCQDMRLYDVALTDREKEKQSRFSKIPERADYLAPILEDLTPDDVRHLIQYEDELTQLGRFEKVFPTNETHEYSKIFKTQRYYNNLLDAWEERFHGLRDEGIATLQKLCRTKYHLSELSLRLKSSILRS